MNGSVDATHQRREAIAAKRRQLQDELHKILEQKAAIDRQLETLKQRGVAIPAAPLGRAGSAHVSPTAAIAGKRAAPLGALEPANKRQRILDQRRQRVRDIYRACKNILSTLKKNSCAHPFHLPVDADKSGARDYYKVITQPIDMQSIMKKLDQGKYSSPLEFAADMRLMWRNCATYNPPSTTVASMGTKMEAAWEQKWQTSGLEQKWAAELVLQKQEEEELEEKLTGTPAEQMQQLNSRLQSNLAQKDVKQPPLGAAGAVAAAAPAGDRPMTFEEKRRLSVALGQLSGDALGGVLDIIAVTQPGLDPESEQEVELDLDALADAVLWKLKAFVDLAVAAPAGAKPAKTTSGAPGSGAPEVAADGQHEQQSRPPPQGDGDVDMGDGGADMSDEGEGEGEGEGEEEGEGEGEAEGGASKMDSTFDGSQRPGAPTQQQMMEESRTGAPQKTAFVQSKPAAPVVQGLNQAAWATAVKPEPSAAPAPAPASDDKAAAAAPASPGTGEAGAGADAAPAEAPKGGEQDNVWASFQEIAASQAAKKKQEEEEKARALAEEERQRVALEEEEKRIEQERLAAKEQAKAQLAAQLDTVEKEAEMVQAPPVAMEAMGALLNPASDMAQLGLKKKVDDGDTDDW